jgi:hypothetical protein
LHHKRSSVHTVPFSPPNPSMFCPDWPGVDLPGWLRFWLRLLGAYGRRRASHG